MRIGVISDVHLGDEKCKMVSAGRITGTYRAFCSVVWEFTGGEPLDYLVLNGDILDFSINSFAGSCKAAKPFFRAIARNRLARQIVYIPGNHDKHVWDTVEWQTNVVMRMGKHDDPREFRRTQPAVIAYPRGAIILPGVSKLGRTRRFGGLFLEGLFSTGNVLPINVAYPNLYIVTPTDVHLVTHGHMLELAWVLLSELLSAEPELEGAFGLRELEEYNTPLTAMICTGVGQAGKVSDVFYKIQQEAKGGEADRLKKALKNVVPKLEKMIQLHRILEPLDDVLLAILKRVVPYIAKQAGESRYNAQFLKRKAVRRRFRAFYEASCRQAGELGLSSPSKVIFGHTHEPIPASDPMKGEKLAQLGDHPPLLYNTGGWLRAEGKSAEVFFFDDDGLLSSVNMA